MEYHDLDTTYLDGLLADLKDEYSGDLTAPIVDTLKYLEPKKYSVADSHLTADTKKLRLLLNGDLRRVNLFLNKCQRSYIETEPGNNNALRAVHMQLHVPREFTVDMLRHQIAEHFAQYPDFFAPKMKEYLKNCKISYNRYIYAVYHGEIWCDEYILGAISRMYNIRLSIISPLFSDLWNVYHDGKGKPDVVLVINGRGFRTHYDRITHFTATKGTEHKWQCVGSSQQLQAVDMYTGYSEGQMMGLDFRTINQSQTIVQKGQQVLKDVNELCRDIKRICIRRDEIITDLKTLDIEVGDFRKLTSYYIQEELPEFMNRRTIPATKRKLEIFPSTSGSIPKVRVKDIRQTEVGQQILRQRVDETDTSEWNRNIQQMKEIQSTAHTKTISEARDREYVKQVQKQKERGDVQQMSVKEQTVHDQEAPPRKRCKIKSGGRNVRAPSMLQMNLSLPSLGIYETMIRTPEKKPVQTIRQYQLVKNKEEESREEMSEKEEGEIDESRSDIQGDLPEDIEKYEEGTEGDGNETDEKQEDSDSEMDLNETNQETIEHGTTSSDDEDISSPEFDLPLEKIVQIPPEMLIPPEEVKQEVGSEDEALNQIENADKQIDALEEMIRKRIEESREKENTRIEESREKENKRHDTPSEDISQTTTAPSHRKVITVQPIASYDEIFSTSNQPTEGKVVESQIEVKKEPGTVENDDDLIFVQHEYPNVDTQIKSEPTELETAKQHPSKKRTIILKQILKAVKQPEPQSIVRTVSASTLPKMVADTKGKRCTTGKPGVKLVVCAREHSERGNVPTISSTPKAIVPGKAVREVKSSTTGKQSEQRSVPKMFAPPKVQSSTHPLINIADITRGLKVKKQEETVGVHTMKSDKVAMPTIQKRDIIKPKARAPLHIDVQGNIDKQTTIQGNVKNLTIHHVTTPSATSRSHPAIVVTSPSELSIHVPSVQARTQSQLAMEYKSRERMKGKQIVEVQRNVIKGTIQPPVPVSEQSEEYYYCDKCPKKFKSKSYYRIHMRRLCEALENPQVLVCNTCGKFFKHEKNYRNHLGVHDGVKRFACRRCGQKFLRESELMKHRNICRVAR